jgi:regulatory protein
MEDCPELKKLTQTADGNGYTVVFADGSSFVIRHPFAVELEAALPSPDFDLCRRLSTRSDCYHRALALLARREHSALQLRRKLITRDFDNPTISTVLGVLEAENSLSDERFAETWLASRLSGHPEGRTRLIAGLMQRGIDGGLARRALDCYLADNPEALRNACLTYLIKLNRNNTPTEELIEKAKKRGFDRNIIADCADEFYTCTGKSYTDKI